MNMKQKVEQVAERRKPLQQGGGSKEIEKQHGLGKLTAWERLGLLFDEGAFEEINLWAKSFKTGFDIDERDLPRDAVVIGCGNIHGRPALAYAHDFTTLAGTFGVTLRAKVSKIMMWAVEEGIPYIGIVDSGGERLHDMFGRGGFRQLARGTTVGGAGGMYYSPHLGSGVIPQISLLLGPCYAGSAYSPMMVDWYIMRKNVSFMSVASPELLKAVTFVDATRDEIGGALLHATTTGCCDILTDSDEEAVAKARELMSFFPSNWKTKPPVISTTDSPERRDEGLLDI
ncbi:MAG: carboxyl transferase domain-containing protein, partial [Chloroflexota bacterium]|nr:carboxyl transferase domain-containing protein [Chloroflexota bacterium]